MRIGIDLRLPAAAPGGISQYAVNLVAGLAACDRDNDYLILQSSWDREPRIPAQAPRFQRCNVSTFCHQVGERQRLAEELAPRRLDLLHSPDYIPPAFGVRRRVISVHDLSFLHFPEHLTPEARGYYTDQIEWAVSVADAILTDSESARCDVIERLRVPAGKITVTPLAARAIMQAEPDAAVLAAVREKYNLPGSCILFVGTLEPRKNVPFLLRVYARARAEHGLDLPLVLVGRRGWKLDELEAALREQPETVRLLGYVTDEELACLYRVATLLALPSLYEGFGLPVIEAMASGCPVVVSRHGALPEVVGEAGVLLDTEDEGPWADTLARLASDAEFRAGFARAGRARAEQFSWQDTARKTLDVYRRLA